MVLSTLDTLPAEVHHDFYNTLGLKVIANGDSSLEATGAFGEELSFIGKTTYAMRFSEKSYRSSSV